VIRRCRTTWTLVALAAAALANRAEAASIATYQLKNTGTTTVNQVIAEIEPAGSVYAPANSQQGPLTVLDGSSGFNASGLTIGIGTGKLANGDPLQVLNLQFDSAGFAPGAVLDFSLNLGSNYAGPSPTLVLEDPTTGLAPAGLSLTPYTPPVTTPTPPTPTPPPSSGSTPGAQVPEPHSLALWSAATGLGLLHVRALRRTRAHQASSPLI
jgi:hypothetical protein